MADDVTKFLENLPVLSEKDLKRNKIESIGLMVEKSTPLRLIVKYKSGFEKTIEGLDKIEKFYKKLI